MRSSRKGSAVGVSNGDRKIAKVIIFQKVSFYTASRLTAVLLISALLVPLFFLNRGQVVSAQAQRSAVGQTPAATAAPPEPFVIGTGDSSLSSRFMGLGISSALSVKDYFSSPQLPAEFSSAKVPALSENLYSSVNSVLAFLVPVNSGVSALEPLTQPSANVDFDFDGDGKTDISRWQSSSQEWRVKASTGGSVTNLTIGSSTSVIVPGDYDGDDITDRAVFSAGSWTVKKSTNGGTLSVSWGTTGDKPVPADYDGDDITDFAIFRPSTNAWWILYSSNSSYVAPTLGTSGDILVPADYEGDGKADIAVYRPSNGNWYVVKSSGGSSTFTWGNSGDTPVPADYDGDGKTDYAIYRPSTGAWWIYKSSNGTYTAPVWGNYGDQPVPGDYDGDGKADLAIWRPANGVWYIIKSSNGAYLYDTMGQIGDTAAPSAYTKQIGAQPITNALAKARLSPRNAAGGTNYYSQNFNWATELVGLSGRAGLDLGLGISYNSLVWTKQGGNMYFDTDYSNVSPGFRLGFPTIEPVYQEAGGDFYYVLVSPSGARKEFKQTAVTNSYETADSSYLMLKVTGASHPTDPVENLTITVSGTDGTQATYEWKSGAYRCKEIKDRNGNYISIYHSDSGHLYTITDTLGRVITINYDNDLYPTSITQTWKGSNGTGSNVTHTYATFAYTAATVSTSFSGITTVYGPPNNTVLKVLDTITYADAHSYTKFDYNGYAQVGKIRNYAYDGHLLSSVTTNLNELSGSFSDCPRLGYTKNWAQNFNGDTDDTESNSESVTIHNDYQENASDTMPDGLTGTKTKVTVYAKDHWGGSIVPDGQISNTYFRASGWNEGLAIATQDCLTNCTGGNQKSWTSTAWTQDDTGLSYMLNPRVTEVKTGDGSSTKRIAIDYYNTPGTGDHPYGLVTQVTQYDSNQTSVLKRSVIEYNLSSSYTDRRILGLPSKKEFYDGSSNLMSKMTFGYDDESSFTFESSSYGQNISPIQHDNTNYGTSFATGRGNMTSATRWDVTAPTNSGYAVTSGIKHDTAGSVVARIDPMGRKIKVGYYDNFNDTGTSRNTYAYPTKITEMANTNTSNNFSELQYRFDIGTNVWLKSPHPDANYHGKVTTKAFDSNGKLEREATVVDGTEKTYVRYEYPTNGIQRKMYATVVDADGDDNIAEDEILARETWTDGVGRVRQTRFPHPGSTGGYSASLVEYDALGRVTRTSVPTEVDSSWHPAGDDYRGMTGSAYNWLWETHEYDWKGRTTRSIPSDSTGSDGKDTLISYDSCGCAGAGTMTIQGPSVPVPGETFSARRKQKSYTDILGRMIQEESYNWDGSTVYSTIVNSYNARDQITGATRYDGTASSSTHQAGTVSYDGHGRRYTTHKPEQYSSSPSSPTYTTYTYNADDTVAAVTDGRGAVRHFDYNARGLLDEISYTVPGGSGITDPADITFSYDDVGNRLSMYDGLGHVDYEYDELSQLKTETRQFNDTLTDAPLSSNRFKLEYTYRATGQLKSYKDPYGKVIDFAQDSAGRLSSVTGSSFGGVTTYANNPEYRAWGAPKHLEYGNDMEMDLTYDDARRPATFQVKDPGNSSRNRFDRTYEYYPDGMLKLADEVGTTSFINRFDRSFTYDQLGRVSSARSGAEATGGTQTNHFFLPYHQDYTYDALGNLTGRDSTLWNYTHTDWSFNYYIVNNRILDSGYSYDNDGNQTAGDNMNFQYDASGGVEKTWRSSAYETLFFKNGDGVRTKTSQRTWDSVHSTWDSWESRYYIYSSVLGKVVTDVGPTGKKKTTYVIAGEVLARQGVDINNNERVGWEHQDPSGLSARSSDVDGVGLNDEADVSEELDGLGNNVGTIGAFNIVPKPQLGLSSNGRQPFGDMEMGDCYVDGMTTRCSVAHQMLESGAGIPYSVAKDRLGLPGFKFESYGLGIYGWHAPDREAQGTGGGTGEDDDPIQMGGVDGGAWHYFTVSTPRSHNFGGEIITVTSVSKTKPKGLPDCIKNYLIKRWKMDSALVNNETYTRNDPIALRFSTAVGGFLSYTYNFSGTGAFTWGYNIDFLEKEFDESDGISDAEVKLAAHEITHSKQYAANPNFVLYYLLNFAANGIDNALFKSAVDLFNSSISQEAKDAYRRIEYEVLARKFADEVEEDIKKHGNPCDPNSFNGQNYGH